MEAGVQGQHLLQHGGYHGVLLRQQHEQGPLYLLLLVGGLELDVGVPEHIAVNHDEDRFLDELAQLASKLCEVFFPLKRQPKEVKLIVLLYQILDETYSIWQ